MSKLKYIVWLLIWLLPNNGWTAASVAVTVSAPSTSSAAVSGKSIVKSMLFSPCVASATDFGKTTIGTATTKGVSVSNVFDQLNIKITGSNEDVDKANSTVFDYDLYFLIAYPGGTGSASPSSLADYQFYFFRRYNSFEQAGSKLVGVEVQLRKNPDDFDTANAPYVFDPLLRAQDFTAATINEVILGGDIKVDEYQLPRGTWLAVAILIPTKTQLNLNDPKTWTYWDAFPFILGSPWKTTSTDATTNQTTIDACL